MSHFENKAGVSLPLRVAPAPSPYYGIEQRVSIIDGNGFYICRDMLMAHAEAVVWAANLSKHADALCAAYDHEAGQCQ